MRIALDVRVPVRIAGIRPELMMGLMICDRVMIELFDTDIVLTSITDGKHSRGSLHYAGQAGDIRSRHMTPKDASYFLIGCEERLGVDFDIILEAAHFHLEYQPKEPFDA